jgi:hypothetical protein
VFDDPGVGLRRDRRPPLTGLESVRLRQREAPTEPGQQARPTPGKAVPMAVESPRATATVRLMARTHHP